jgi:tRNA G18 (ribose-2'-O)-methylase SpoU
MQAQGYTIVAVEQTVNSQSLYDFQFPEKTLLLLGYWKNALFMLIKYLCFF